MSIEKKRIRELFRNPVEITNTGDEMPRKRDGKSKGRKSTDLEAPVPLIDPLPDPEPYPVHALAPLEPMVRAIALKSQAPVVIAAQSVLAVASLATQPHANVETLGGSSPLTLLVLTIAASGERKSYCDSLATDIVKQIERLRRADFIKKHANYKHREEVYKLRRQEILKASSVLETEIEAELKSLGPPPTPPASPLILLSNPTFEGIQRYFAEGGCSCAVFTDEGGQILGGHAMKSENKLNTATGFSKLWDAAAINRTRAGGPTQTYDGRRCCVHLLLQPVLARRFLADEDLRDQGLLSRALLAFPKTKIGTRLTSRGHTGREDKLDDAIEDMNERIGWLLTNSAKHMDPILFELSPPCLSLAPEARQLLEDFYDEVERSQAPGGEFCRIQGVASKSAEQAARIAGVLSLIADPETTEVNLEMMSCGICLAKWYLVEALRLLEAPALSKELNDQLDVLNWLLEKWDEEFIDIRTMVARGPRRLRNTKMMRSIARALAKEGHLIPMNQSVIVNKQRSKSAWSINRGD